MESKLELGSIKTEILVAFIFPVLVVVGWVIGLLFGIYYLIVLGILGGSYLGSIFFGLGLMYTVVFLILMIPSLFVMNRTNKMRKAADKGDIAKLMKLNSIGWAIVALIFTGIIPGVMLLIAHGPIAELQEGGLSEDNINRLIKLKTLLDSGVISKEEFEQQKAKITVASSTGGIEEQLMKLKSLLDSGIIRRVNTINRRANCLRNFGWCKEVW
ncbi:MAG: SHOCT domain-containing protein [bacterium]